MTTDKSQLGQTDREEDNVEEPRALDRRDALLAVAKFSAFVAPASLVLLDASAAKAKQPCSTHPNQTDCIP